MNKHIIRFSASPEGRLVFIYLNNPIGIAEACLSFYADYEYSRTNGWYYLSRLFVPEPHRKLGLSYKILGALSKMADREKFNIYNEIIQAPGDGPDLKKLIEIYSKYGFKNINENTMIRHANEH